MSVHQWNDWNADLIQFYEYSEHLYNVERRIGDAIKKYISYSRQENAVKCELLSSNDVQFSFVAIACKCPFAINGNFRAFASSISNTWMNIFSAIHHRFLLQGNSRIEILQMENKYKKIPVARQTLKVKRNGCLYSISTFSFSYSMEI